MSDKILEMMARKRMLKNTDKTSYMALDKDILKIIKRAKESWYNFKCE